VAEAGLARKGRVGQRRKMHLREWNIGIEWPACAHAAPNEVGCPSRDLGIDQPPLDEIIDTEPTALHALAALHDLLEIYVSGSRRVLRGPHRFVCRPRDAIPF